MMLALVAVAATAAAITVLLIVELLLRLLPVLALAAACWVALGIWRRTRRPRHLAAPNQPAGTPLPPPAALPAFPPVTLAAQRRYVVAGADTGFTANRDDGYLRLDPPHVGGTSCPRRRPHSVRHLSRRRPQRERSTRP